MKGLVILIVISLFLLGFIAAGITSKAIENNSNDNNSNNEVSNGQNPALSSINQENNTPRLHRLNETQIKNIVRADNKINAMEKSGKCPNNCTCTGAVVKCELKSGREMTIIAGKSGNTIIQVKGENMTTNVILYNSENKIYGVFKNNETREIKLLPDQVKERIRAKLSTVLENENITLNENGTYQYQGDNKARLFLIIPIKEVVNAQLDSQTGEIVQLKKPWWAFLAKDQGQQLIGASCGTVTPGQNDACCQTKNYDFWNMTAGECQFNSTTSS
jgi:hypothetical protein